MADTLNLLPCPFCGAALEGEIDDGASFHTHPEGDCIFSGWEFDQLNLKAWNRRSTSSVSEGEMPELPKPKYPNMRVLTYGKVSECAGYTAEQVRAAIAADRRKQAALQELVDIAQELDMGYGPSSAATKAAAPADARIESLARTLVEFYPTRLPEMYCDGEPVGRKLVEACQAPAEDAREEVPRAEQVLRRLLAYRVAGASLYADDGQLHDASAQPWIDFKNDSVDSIEGKLIERSRRASSVPAIPGWKLVPVTPTLEMVKAGDLTLNGRGTCVLAWRAMVDAAPPHPLEAKAGGEA